MYRSVFIIIRFTGKYSTSHNKLITHSKDVDQNQSYLGQGTSVLFFIGYLHVHDGEINIQDCTNQCFMAL